MDVKDIIKQKRIELGLTLDDVARMVGVSGATISRWESGDIANMKRDKIVKLANALKISPTVIMEWDDSESTETDIPYYINDEAREMAEFLHKSPEYKVLFDASRKVSAEDIETVKAIIDKFRSPDYD